MPYQTINNMKISVLVFIIISAGILCYSNSLGNDFVWDDSGFLIQNDYVKDLRLIPEYFTSDRPLAKGGLSGENYRPFLPLSLAIDYAIWKFNPIGYHLTNLIFHISNALLCFVLILLISKNKYFAFLTSLFFVVHPIQTEAVTWISGRADVLFLFFYMISLILYVRFDKKQKNIYIAGSVFFFICALLSKEMAATLLFVIVLYDICFGQKKKPRKYFINYSPYIISFLIYFLIRSNIISKIAQCGYWGDSLYLTFLTMTRAISTYISLLFYPVNLCADYFKFRMSYSFFEPDVLFSFFLIIATFYVALKAYKRFKFITFSILWFYITILPVSNIIPIKILVAERFLYIPSIGYCMLISFFIVQAYSFLKSKISRAMVIFASGLVISVYGFMTLGRNFEWTDEIIFWRSNVNVSPNNERAHHNLAVAYLVRNSDIEKAYRHATIASNLAPGYAFPRLVIASYFSHYGQYDNAIEQLNQAIEVNPYFSEAYVFLGSIYAFLGKYEEAYTAYDSILKKDPDCMKAKLCIAGLYTIKNEPEKALVEYNKLLSEDPPPHYRAHFAGALLNVGALYAMNGDMDKAHDNWKEVYCQYSEQVLFHDISGYLLDKISFEEFITESASWQSEFKVIAYFFIGLKNETDGNYAEAVKYYTKSTNVKTQKFNQIKVFAVQRLDEMKQGGNND